MVSLFFCNSASNARGEGLRRRQGSCWEERKRKIYARRGVIDLPFRQINDLFICKKSKLKIIESVARPGGCPKGGVGHGPFTGVQHRNFRMIDSSSTDLNQIQPLDRVRRGSATSLASHQQYEASTVATMTPTGKDHSHILKAELNLLSSFVCDNHQIF